MNPVRTCWRRLSQRFGRNSPSSSAVPARSSMGFFFGAICGWCQRAVTISAVGVFAVFLVAVAAAASQPDAQSGSTLWAQLLQTGVILVVAGAVIRMFFTFK